MSKVERVMLRFRPIAPKPTNNNNNNNNNNDSNNNNNNSNSSGCGSGGSPTTFRRSTRGRKKKATGQNINFGNGVVGSKRKRKPSLSSPENGEKKRPFIKTLSFIPETPDVLRRNCSPSSSTSSPSSSAASSSPMWLSFVNGGGLVVPAGRHVAALGSWVKVERVTDVWTTRWDSAASCPGGVPPWLTDRERVMRLEEDTCPCFVTDGGYGVIRWANAAYKKMVAGEQPASAAGVVAWVVMEEGVAVPAGCVGFTCRVRVVTSGGGGKDKNNCNKTVPCDVWKMDGGGFAWRLDTAAALSLWVGGS